jgi:hypothetical protein
MATARRHSPASAAEPHGSIACPPASPSDRRPHDRQQVVDVHGLRNDVDCPQFHRLDGDLDGEKSTDEHERQVWQPFANCLHHVSARHVRQALVNQHQIEGVYRCDGNALVPDAAVSTLKPSDLNAHPTVSRTPRSSSMMRTAGRSSLIGG